jgi:hypothetical protein
MIVALPAEVLLFLIVILVQKVESEVWMEIVSAMQIL